MSNEEDNFGEKTFEPKEEKLERPTDDHDQEQFTLDELESKLEEEKQYTSEYVEKWKRALADYENLKKRTNLDISNRVTTEINKIILNFLTIYEDLIRAKKVLASDHKNIEGLDVIIKNMDSIFKEYNIREIDTIGQMFDPNLHDAVSIVEDETLDDDTIKEEVAKGYISGNNVIKPSKVIVSKKTEKKE